MVNALVWVFQVRWFSKCGSLSGLELMCIGRLGLVGSGGPSNPPLATCSGGQASPHEDQRQLHNRRHLLPRKRRPGRTRKTWGGDGRGSGGGEEGVGCLTDGARAVATVVGWLGSAGGRDSRFPTRRRRNSQHSPPPAGRPPGSLVLGPQGSRFLGQPWSGKASLLTCPVISPPLGSSSR